MVVAHQVVIAMFRYVLERSTEQEALALAREQELANCSVSVFELDGEGPDARLRLTSWNSTEAVERSAAPVTEEPPATSALDR